jgi:hypothetical protein
MEKLMRINSKSGLSRAAFVLSIVLPLFAIPRAFAQAPPPTGGAAAGAPAAGASAEAERVIVTGSNIPTAEEVGPNPVTNLNKDYIQKTGTSASSSC